MSPLFPLLGLLVRGKRYGYELKHMVDAEFAPYWRIDFGQLYRSLARLERNRWVKVQTTPGVGGPDRKMYALTRKGRDAFEAWLLAPAADRDESLTKLALAAQCSIPVTSLSPQLRQAFEKERARLSVSQREARERGDAGRLVLTQAALADTQSALDTLDQWSSISESATETDSLLSGPPVITGSDDPLMAHLARLAHTEIHPIGSIDGLVMLSQHHADLAGIHLLDQETGEYNIPFIKRLIPEDEIMVVNLAIRENGLLLAQNNPKRIRNVRDLVQGAIRFINRQRGAGTRLLLYQRLRQAHINPHELEEWDHAISTHDGVASAIATGVADVGPGLRATAVAWGLDFIPLGEERYDLAIPRQAFESHRLRTLLSSLHGNTLRAIAADLAGYDLSRSGQVIARIK